MTVRAQPILRPSCLFAFATGVAVLQILPSLPDAWLSLFLMAASLVMLWRFPRQGIMPAFIFGAMFAAWVATGVLSHRLPIAQSGSRADILVEIAGLPQRQNDQLQFEADVLASADIPELQGQRVKLVWYRTEIVLRPGDIRRLDVKLRTPNGVYNPGGFDAEQRALQKRWAAQGYVRSLIADYGHRFTLDRYRDGMSERIRRQLGERPARFVNALALGDTRFLDDDDWNILRQTGITHLIAISGFHVGIVALAAAWWVVLLYRMFPSLGLRLPKPNASAYCAIVAAMAYTAFAGFALPTVRTALMITVFMSCRLLGRRCTVIHAVAMSLAIMLLWDPLAILAPGLWLSFCGVLLLVLFMPQQHGQCMLKSFLRAQMVVSIGLLPLSVGFFGQTTLIGPLVNVLAIPWISLAVVPLALLGCLFSGIPCIAGAIWQLAAFLMQLFWLLLEHLQGLPWTSQLFPEADLPTLLLAQAGTCLLLLPRRIPGRLLGVFLLLPMLQPRLDLIEQGQLRLALIDVGQGTSILLRTRRHALLYDTGAGRPGAFSRGESSVLPALRALAVPSLDRVVISHGDNDHAGGLSAIRDGLEITDITASWQALPGDIPYRECLAGQQWQWDGVLFTYLWPESHDGSKNDRSCILMIQAGARRVLLAGDISAAGEAQLISRYGSRLQAEILLVPHHGSAGSSSASFIATVKPSIALVSSGFQNRFRHPRREVMTRYHAAGTQTVNTADTGWVELGSTAQGWIWLRRARVDQHRYWLHARFEPSVTGY